MRETAAVQYVCCRRDTDGVVGLFEAPTAVTGRFFIQKISAVCSLFNSQMEHDVVILVYVEYLEVPRSIRESDANGEDQILERHSLWNEEGVGRATNFRF